MSTARDQVARMLALVPYVRNRGEAVPLEQAAADLGVSVTQLVADLKVLWYCGLPGLGMGDLIDVDMDALDGEGVVRVSNAEYLDRPLRLRSDEATALVVALRALRDTADAAQRDVVDRALAKLDHATEDAGARAAQVEIDLGEQASSVRLRSTLEDAVRRQVQVRLDYHVPARDASTRRVVDPLAVVAREGHVYLQAWCHAAGGERLFRLDRVLAVEVLDSPVQVPEEHAPRDLADALFVPSPTDGVARLLLAPPARWVADYFPVEEVHERAEGLEVTLRVSDPRWLDRLLLRLTPHAQVLEPQEAAERLRQQATEALALYS